MKGKGEGFVWKEARCEKTVKMAGLRLLSLERAASKTGPYLPSGISGGFPSFLDKNGSLCPN